MQIVINLNEDVYTRLFDNGVPKSLADGIVIDRAIRTGKVLPEHGGLKDVDEIIDKLQNHHDLFISAYNGNFSDMPKDYKVRVDEILNCISVIINATTILEAWGNDE